MKKLILFFAFVLSSALAFPQACPGSLICNSSTLACWDVGNWEANATATPGYKLNVYQPSFTVIWDSLAGAKQYNISWIQEAHLASPSICNAIAHSEQSCLKKTTYGLKTGKGTIGVTPYNMTGSGYYYYISAVMADNSIIVSKLYYVAYLNTNCQGCQDICPTTLSDYAAMPWPPQAVPPAPTEVQKKSTGKSGK